jgi:hypothetical protein
LILFGIFRFFWASVLDDVLNFVSLNASDPLAQTDH